MARTEDLASSDLQVEYDNDGDIVSIHKRRGGPPLNFVLSKSNQFTGGISIIAKVTQAQYDAIAIKDNSTLYVIVP